MFCVRNASGAMLLLSVFFGVGFQSAFAQSQSGSTTADFDYLPAAIELGPARAYNGFFLDDFESISAQTQGRLAAGGDIAINHYQVADQLQAGASGASLVVGGDLNFPEGQVHRGDILVGGSAAGLGSAVIDALTPEQSVQEFAELPIDFESAFAVIRTTSQTLGSLPANGSVDWLSGELHLSGDCEGRAQVFALDGQQVLDATTFELSCIPDGATVIFNIDGQHSGLIEMSLASLTPHRQNTLFNFYQAELLTLSGVDVQGSILAPLAHVDQPQGSINGQVIARSWNGPMQLNHVPFRGVGAGDFCAMYPIALPFDLLESAAPETTFDQVPRGTGAGQFSWLTWAGSPNAPVLANSLIPPGDSYTYVNPDDDSAWPLVPEHWVEGAAGSMNSEPVRTNLDVLIGTEIVAPAWSAIRGQGNNLDYQVADFARIRLLDYRLTGNGWLSFEFIGWTHCYNRPPIAFDQHLETETNTPIDIELSGEDPDGDELTFEVVTEPTNGWLDGEPPMVQYIPNADFVGTDSFNFVVDDGFLVSAPATVTIEVTFTNQPPLIVSDPVTLAVEDALYHYPVEAVDPDIGDVLTYTLQRAPDSMHIDSAAGLIEWVPDASYVGNNLLPNEFCYAPSSLGIGSSATADVVFVVDESGSMRGEHAWIPGFAFGLESHLLANEVGNTEDSNLFGLIGYTRVPREFLIDGEQMGSVYAFMEAAGLLRTNFPGTEDGWRAIRHALTDYPMREGSARNIILITDEGRDITDPNITYESLLGELNDANAILNAVVNARFKCTDSSGEVVPALGMDANNTGYLADGQGGYLTCTDPVATWGHTNTINTLYAYVDLALDTGGAAWDLFFLRAGGNDALSFANALNDIKIREILEHLPPQPRSDLTISRLWWVDGQVRVQVENRGLLDGVDSSSLEIFAGSALFDTLIIPPLPAGAHLEVQVALDAAHFTGVDLRAVLTPGPNEQQCNTDNHELISPLVTVRATDTGGLYDEQTYGISVIQSNSPPVFVSDPLTAASVSTRYRYDALAVDPDVGDALRYSLMAGPAGMMIDAYGGLVTFFPNMSQVGTHEVVIQVEDLSGETATQVFELEIDQNYHFPRFVSEPSVRVVIETPYEYQTEATADPAAELEFSALMGPDGLTIDAQTGLVEWLVPDDVAGQRMPLALRVRDQFGNYDLQIFDLLGDIPNEPPRISSNPGLLATKGSNYVYVARVHDPNYFEEHTWNVVEGPENLVINADNGRVSWAGSSVSATAPEGVTQTNPYCLISDSEVASLHAREDWRWTSGVTRFTQPLVIPLLYDPSLGAPELEEIQLVVGVTWSGGGIGSRALHALNLETGGLYWSYNDHEPHWGVAPAAADLDKNGIPEIVFVDSNYHLVAVDSFGQFKWVSEHPVAHSGANLNESALVVADINLNGRPEIVAGSSVFAHDGTLLWSFADAANWHSTATRASALVADLTGDGRLEVAKHDQVRNADGSLLWNLPLNDGEGLQRAHFGVGDLDGNGHPALVASIRSNQGTALLAVSADGELLWRHHSTLVQHVSPPLVADFTRNDRNDVFLPGGSILFDADGEIVWQHTDVIARREYRNALATDLTGDGWLEILMHGGNNIIVLSGQHGLPLYTRSWGQRADRAGIVPALVWPHNQSTPRMLSGGNSGLLVLQPAWGNWPTRADEFTQVEIAPGSLRHENLRILQPPLLDQPATIFLPDLHVEAPRARTRPGASGKRVDTVVRNRGTAPTEGGIHLELYRGDPGAGGVLLHHRLIEQTLLPGQTVSVQQDEFTREDLGEEVFALVYFDDEQNVQCETGNTLSSGVSAQIRVEDHGGLDDTQVWTIGVREGLITPTFVSSPPAVAIENERYGYQAQATDPNTGDFVTYSLTIGPKDARLHPLTGELTWTPRWGQTGSFQFRIQARDLTNRTQNQTFWVTVEESSEPNEPPVILSLPITSAQLGQDYSYQVIAEDPDGHELNYHLLEGPDGMNIHPRTGLVTWVASTASGNPVAVTIQVQDERGATAEQSYSITVYTEENRPPEIISTPSLAVNLGETWVYEVEAIDPDGDPLVYQMLQAPAGATMDGAGLAQWTPETDQLGEHAFMIEVRDDRGGWARQSFTVYVNDAAVNNPPVILSTPPLTAIVGLPYSYQVEAIDPDGDDLHYVLASGPFGAAMDTTEGLLAWVPTLSQLGENEFELHVFDGNGGVAWQHFTVVVEGAPIGNQPPVIHSTPPLTAKAGFGYRYDIVASDPDGDELVFSLVEGPDGMALDAATGELTWLPEAQGLFPVTVSVADDEFTVSQSWQVDVLDGSVPLSLTLEISPAVADVGQTVEIRLIPEAAAGQVVAEVMVNDTVVTVDPDLIARYVPSEPGEHMVLADIDDGFEQAQANDSFFVRDPNAEGGPFVSLSTPDYEAEITAPTMIIGTVQDDDLDTWVLAWAEAGTQNWTILAEGSEVIDEADIAVFDPTLLINGQYRIALQAWDSQGRMSSDSREIQVTGDMKLGHFAITFEDATVPLSGIPITLTRTYDTRQRHQNLDFGFGWSVGYQDVRLHESRRVGLGWSLNEYRQGFFSTWCVEPNGDPIVTVRLPDDEVHRFKAKAEPECQQLVPFIDVHIVFEALPGTHSELEQLDHGMVRLINGNIAELDEPDTPIDPDRYRLILEDGTVLRIDQHFGLRQLTDGDANTLTFTRDGITHSSGVGIDFVRDSHDRITQVLLPDGGILDYLHDTHGNLIAFADQAENITQFTYLAGADHYLEDIIDPRGVRAIRNEYDDDGRLVAQIDADGNRLEFDRDIQGRVETIRDRRGNATVYIYDERGNVLSETNALGETTSRTYDEFGNELTRIDPLGHTWAMAYDSRGNQTAETDPLGHTNHYAYNNRGLVTSHTAPDGTVVMENQYNASTGNLTATTDALGNQTTFNYETGGNLTRITDALGQQTHYVYDGRGNLIRQTDSMGVETVFTYDAMGRVLTETVSWIDDDDVEHTHLTKHQYDAAGNRTRTTDPLGAIREFEYDAAGLMTAEIDPLGRRTEYEFDNRGNQVRVIYPDGSAETSEYDPEGNLIAETDRAGRTTRMVYDAAGRLIETILPDNTPDDDSDNPRRYSIHDGAGRLVEEVDELGNSTFYGYDDAGRNTKVTDALGNETVYEYDNRGQRTAMIDARGNRTEYIYDAAGRLERTIHPNDTESSVSYDALGQKVAETDPAGRTTQFEYDAAGRLLAVIDALGQRTEYGYDGQGNRIAQTDANGNSTTWSFDIAGRVVSRTLPLGQTETYGYDLAGQRTAHTDFKGQTVEFTYDALSRPVETIYPDGSTVETRYAPSGQVWEIEVSCSPAPCSVEGKDVGVTVHQYDERDRLTRIDYPDGRWIEYDYDEAGNRIELRTANQRTRYAFDALNRLSTVTACANADCSSGDTTTYQYNEVGSRRLVQHANGTTTEYQYDSLNRLTLLTTWDAFGAVIHRQQFHLGAAGHREMLVEDSQRVVEYTYDAVYRLVEEKVTDPRGDRTTAYTFDATGNRLSRTTSCDPECHGEVEAGTTTYVYDVNDRLLEETGPDGVTLYQYDLNGNTISRISPDGTVDYHYNPDDRLIRATGDLESGATESTYTYDAHGIRQRQMVDGITSRFLVDPTHQFAQVLEELGSIGNPMVTYVIGHERISQTRAEGHFTYHADGLGSIRVLTDDTGTATDSYVYEAYGNVEHSERNTPNSFRYTGEQYDPNLGFYYLRARYYDPSTGRLPTSDLFSGLIRVPVSLNKYIYAHSSPINLRDPSGLTPLAEKMAVHGVQSTLRTISVQTVRVNTKRVAANDALWVASAGVASPMRGAAIGLLTSLALSASSTGRDRLIGPPIIVFGKSFEGHAQHILDAQMAEGSNFSPAPFALNRMPPWPRSWLRSTEECNRKVKKKAGGGLACDEYPFASTRQGGPVNYIAFHSVSLRLLDLGESDRTRDFIRNFYNTADIYRDGVSKKSRFIALGIPNARSFFTDRMGRVHFE